MTQPVLSRALREVEEILGVSLYERGPRGVSPTIFGEAFTDHARAVLAQLGQASRHVAELVEATRGTVIIGTHLAGSNLLLPRAIGRFKAERPNVNVIIREAPPDTLLADLEAGRLDFIIGRLTGISGAPTMTQRMLYDEPILLVARVGHPVLQRTALTIADLVELPWILPGTETVLHSELEQLFLRHDLALPADRIECTSILALRSLLVETDVIAALPMLIARDDPRVVPLPISLSPISHTVGITHPAARQASPAARALLDHLFSQARHVVTTIAS